jgi:TetR/AcrR family transcriptional regulator
MNAVSNPAAPLRAGSDTVDRILAAAEALFSERGFNAVSMNDIAARTGVSKANVFHHFNSKQALYVAVLRAACQAAERLEFLGSNTGPFPERLAVFAEKQLTNLLEHADVSRLILHELLTGGEQRGREFAEKVFGDNFARFVEILRLGQARGELRADIDPAMAATLLIGANVFFFQAQEVLRHFPDVNFARDPGRYSRMLADILLHGILAKPNNPTTSDD